MNSKVLIAGVFFILFGLAAFAIYDIKVKPDVEAGKIYREAQIVAQRGNRESYNSAVSSYIKIMAAYPNSSYAVKSYVSFCDLYEKLGLYRQASINYNYFLKKYFKKINDKQKQEIYSRIAALKLRENRTDEGLNQLYTILNQTSENNLRARIYSEIGYCWLKRGELKKSLDGFNLSLYENPNNEESSLGKARVLVRQGEYDDAFDIYDQFLKYNGEFSPYADDVRKAYLSQAYDIGITSFRKGNYQTSLSMFKRIIRNFPGSKLSENAVYLCGESYYQLGQYSNAAEMFTRTMTNSYSYKDDQARLKRGFSYFALKNYHKAAKDFDSYLSSYPKSAYSATAQKWKDAALNEISQKEKVDMIPENDQPDEKITPDDKKISADINESYSDAPQDSEVSGDYESDIELEDITEL